MRNPRPLPPLNSGASLTTYPPSQKFGKGEVALFELTWLQKPHIVCRGGQKAFAEYMDTAVLDMGSVEGDAREDQYRQIFRDLVAKAILFKTTDRIVHRGLPGSHEPLGGTYKRPVVAYTIAYLLHVSPRPPDLDLIWRTQSLSASVSIALADIAEALKDALIHTGHGQNITEWAKKRGVLAMMRRNSWTSLFTTDEPGTHYLACPVKGATGSLESVEASRTTSAETLVGRHRGELGKSMEGDVEAASDAASWHRTSERRRDRRRSATCLPVCQRTDYQSDADNRPYTLVVAVDFPARHHYPRERAAGGLRARWRLGRDGIEENSSKVRWR